MPRPTTPTEERPARHCPDCRRAHVPPDEPRPFYVSSQTYCIPHKQQRSKQRVTPGQPSYSTEAHARKLERWRDWKQRFQDGNRAAGRMSKTAAAARLGVTKQTITNWQYAGWLPPTVTSADVERLEAQRAAYLARHPDAPTSPGRLWRNIRRDAVQYGETWSTKSDPA